jgi:hypothetical protein
LLHKENKEIKGTPVQRVIEDLVESLGIAFV